MSLHVEIPDAIAAAAQAVATRAGVSPEQLILEALGAHFPPLEPALQIEFEAWDRASEEDAAALEGLDWPGEA